MWECVCDASLLWWLPYPGWFQDAAPDGCQILVGSRMQPASGQVIIGVTYVSVTVLIKAHCKHWLVSNGLHSESPLQTCQQCNGQCKARYQSWPMGSKTWPVHRDIGDAGWKHVSPLIERKQTHVETDVSHFVETVETQVHGTRLWCQFHSNGLYFHACYKSSLWAQRSNHFTWPVTSCGNGRCLIPVTNPICAETRVK
jgi:hypothetical protein